MGWKKTARLGKKYTVVPGVLENKLKKGIKVIYMF